MNGRKVSSSCVCEFLFLPFFLLLFIILNVTARWIIFAWTLLCIVLVSLCVIDLSITSLLHIFFFLHYFFDAFLAYIVYTHKMHDHFGWMNWLLAEITKFRRLNSCQCVFFTYDERLVVQIEFFLSIFYSASGKK